MTFLMQASKGALTEEVILRMPWRRFGVYLDSFTYWIGEQTEEGQRKNKRADVKAMKLVPEVKERHAANMDADRQKLAAWRARRAAAGKKPA